MSGSGFNTGSLDRSISGSNRRRIVIRATHSGGWKRDMSLASSAAGRSTEASSAAISGRTTSGSGWSSSTRISSRTGSGPSNNDRALRSQ